MKLYLVRHGDAVGPHVDPARPLSAEGIREVEHVASLLASGEVRVARVHHSGKERAHQTARILLQTVGPAELVQTPGLRPGDPAEAFADVLETFDEDVMVVGHLPFVAVLLHHLARHDTARHGVEFAPATVVSLDRDDAAALRLWSIDWAIDPRSRSLPNR